MSRKEQGRRRLGSAQREIMVWLYEWANQHGKLRWYTAAEVSEGLGRQPSWAASKLRALEERGLVRDGRNGSWKRSMFRLTVAGFDWCELNGCEGHQRVSGVDEVSK